MYIYQIEYVHVQQCNSYKTFLRFTQQKLSLSRKLIQNKISKEKYKIQLNEYQKIYNKIIMTIYRTIKEKFK